MIRVGLIIVSLSIFHLEISSQQFNQLLPGITVSLDSISQTIYSGNETSQTFTITNNGSQNITLEIDTENGHGSGGSNHALWFDGVDDIVEIPDNPTLRLTSGMTLEAWINFEAGGTMQPRVLSKGPDGEGYEIVTDNESDNRTIQLRIGPGELTSSIELKSQQWYHIAYTYDGSVMNFYVNGNLDSQGYASGPLRTSATNLYLGQKSTGAWDKYKGFLDEVRIWKTARSQLQIQANMNREIMGQPPDLAGYWPLDEGNGSEVYDQTGNDNHGKLIGGTKWVTSDAPVMSWLQLDPIQPVLAPGESVQIYVSFNAIDMVGDDYLSNITIKEMGSDTVQQIPVSMHVVNAPSLEIEPDSIDFGNIFLNVEAVRELQLQNDGSENLIITDQSVGEGSYLIKPMRDTLPPGEDQSMSVVFNPKERRTYPSFLTVQTNDPVYREIQVQLTGQGIFPPEIRSAEPLTAELHSGKYTEKSITIGNSNNLPVNLSVIPGDDVQLRTLYLDGTEDHIWIS
ncbi:MAG: LamG-like jellyroll fold domain-containing protein, partial [Bacteroidales bacterium]